MLVSLRRPRKPAEKKNGEMTNSFIHASNDHFPAKKLLSTKFEFFSNFLYIISFKLWSISSIIIRDSGQKFDCFEVESINMGSLIVS